MDSRLKYYVRTITMLIILVGLGFYLADGTETQAATNRIWDNCSNTMPQVTIVYDISFPYWSNNPDIIAAASQLNGEPVEWDSSMGIHYPEDVYAIGWIHMVLSDGSIQSAWVWQGETSEDYYFLIMDTLDWFGADYNPTPSPHITCGVWRVAYNDFALLADLVEQHQMGQ